MDKIKELLTDEDINYLYYRIHPVWMYEQA